MRREVNGSDEIAIFLPRRTLNYNIMEANGVYYDCDDAENATQEILPTISSIVLNPRFSHLKMNYDLLVEMVAYLTIRLA